MSVVYFARRLDGPGNIKIGCTEHPEFRLKALSGVAGEELGYIATAPGTFADEAKIHRTLSDSRAEGEWFLASAEVLAMVEHINRIGELPASGEAESNLPPLALARVRVIKRVRAHLCWKGATKKGLAAACGLHINTLQGVNEAGWSPSFETLIALERHLTSAPPSDTAPAKRVGVGV